jgi:transketolase
METYLKDLALQARKDVVDQIYASRIGNIGGCMSATEIIVYLYSEFLKIDSSDPNNIDRDRFILSKGQAAPVLYSMLAYKGFINHDELNTFRQLNSRLQTHPELGKLPGVEFSTGSLGQGLSGGIGMSLALRKLNSTARVVVMVGDGELQEGQIWEAALSASHFNLSNLILVVDNNKLQDFNFTSETIGVMPIREKFEAFGWSVADCNGHDFGSISDAFSRHADIDSPYCIVAETVKGKGINYMENSPVWHGIQNMTEEQHKEILTLIEEGIEINDKK